MTSSLNQGQHQQTNRFLPALFTPPTQYYLGTIHQMLFNQATSPSSSQQKHLSPSLNNNTKIKSSLNTNHYNNNNNHSRDHRLSASSTTQQSTVMPNSFQTKERTSTKPPATPTIDNPMTVSYHSPSLMQPPPLPPPSSNGRDVHNNNNYGKFYSKFCSKYKDIFNMDTQKIK